MNIFTAIALGSNIGNKTENIVQASAKLSMFINGLILSPLYTSAPMYFVDQPSFVNGVLVGYCTLDPRALLQKLKDIEVEMGRDVTFNNGPRLIDLDIILYGDKMLMQEDLHIPHSRMSERPFVMRPLADLVPDIIHPVTGLTMLEMHGNLTYTKEDLYALAG